MKLSQCLLLLVSTLASAAVIQERKVNYDGYRVYRIFTHKDAASVERKISRLNGVRFNLDTSVHLDVAIPPQDIKDFEALGLESEVMHEDLGLDIAIEGTYEAYPAKDESSLLAAVPPLSWFNSYHPFADHQQYIRDLQAAWPSNSELIQAGTSYQGRPLYGIHFWGSGGKGSKPAIYWHGTVHAREWITTMVVEYLAYQLINGYLNNDASVKAIVDKYDFYILPVVNPDGFVYSQTTDRLWRKNRVPRSSSSCIGTDVNRNWPFKWELTGGASTSPCQETYKGVAAADTPEMRGLKAFTDSLSSSRGIKLYIDFHSYGQYILLPYGYDCSLRAANNARQTTLATNTANAIRAAYGTRYTYGPSCSTLYKTTGSSVDYLTAVAAAEIAWTIELRPTGSGTGGFILPAAQILPTAVETWDGIKYLLANV